MGRPKQDYRVQRNGGSLQVFDREGLVGSISLAALCEIIRRKKASHTTTEPTQTSYLKDRGV